MTTQQVMIGGQLRPVKFGMAAMNRLCKHYDIKFSELQSKLQDFEENDDLDFSLTVVHAALADGARYERQPFDHDVDDVSDWIDETPEAFTEIFNTLAQEKSETKKKPKRTAAKQPKASR